MSINYAFKLSHPYVGGVGQFSEPNLLADTNQSVDKFQNIFVSVAARLDPRGIKPNTPLLLENVRPWESARGDAVQGPHRIWRC
jgi:hypothetical protein